MRQQHFRFRVGPFAKRNANKFSDIGPSAISLSQVCHAFREKARCALGGNAEAVQQPPPVAEGGG